MGINEKLYKPIVRCDVLDELDEVRKHGASRAYEAKDFPWAYAHSKNLTERLLERRFSDANKKLLIERPAIIGPSQRLSFPGFNMPMSSPITMTAAALLLFPFRKLKIVKRMDEPIRMLLQTKFPLMWLQIVFYVVLLWAHPVAFMP